MHLHPIKSLHNALKLVVVSSSGTPEGKILTWSGRKCIRCVQAHGEGPATNLPDGTKSYGGVRVLILNENLKSVASGGADGYVVVWDTSFGDLGTPQQRVPILEKQNAPNAVAPAVRGLDWKPGSNGFVVGTTFNTTV